MILTCCGKKHNGAKAIIKHLGTTEFTGDRRMIFQCDKHRRFTAKCYNCKLCRYIHKIDKKLWKKKLTLDQYTGIYSGGMPGTWFEGCE